jgi:hypothetical protein
MTKVSRRGDIDALLLVAQDLYGQIEGEYQSGLARRCISPKLPVYIKNYLENLRAPLDYVARDIAEHLLSLPTSHHAYFPVACSTRNAFAKHMSKNFPKLQSSSTHLYTAMEACQAFQPGGCQALPTLSRLVNGNKHNHLSEQTKTESKGLDVEFPGDARISMPPGAAISGGGMISSGGGWFSPGGQSVSGETPATVGKGVKQTVKVWVSFTFTETGDEVLSLLRKCRKDVDRILADLAPLIW